MAKRLSVKHRKQRLDILADRLKGNPIARHKVAVERSKKAKGKKAFPMV
jgi:hypothetical protein